MLVFYRNLSFVINSVCMVLLSNTQTNVSETLRQDIHCHLSPILLLLIFFFSIHENQQRSDIIDIVVLTELLKETTTSECEKAKIFKLACFIHSHK